MKAFLVAGPESSGTRMVTEALIKAGAFGQSSHAQEMDDLNFFGRPDLIVLRRSVPHGNGWPDLTVIIRNMIRAGYAVSPIMTYRDKDYCIQSQMRAARQMAAEQGLPHIVKESTLRAFYFTAYQNIFSHLAAAGMLPIICHYSSFVNNAEYRAVFFNQLGLPCPDLELFDANMQYQDVPGSVPQGRQ
jgi:hypothetical protein